MFHPLSLRRLSSSLLALAFALAIALPFGARGAEDVLSHMQARCEGRVLTALREERDIYRKVQYEDADQSVLGTEAARASDLVPYLVLNYHALDCRLRAFCEAVDVSHGHGGAEGSSPPQYPIGCSRLFAARGRWWSEDRRELGWNTLPVPECAYADIVEESGLEPDVPLDFFTVAPQCNVFVDQILAEERQMLRLLVAQESARRGTRHTVGVVQAVLRDIRDSFLEPLRGVVDLFGAVIHPIPCLLSQCD